MVLLEGIVKKKERRKKLNSNQNKSVVGRNDFLRVRRLLAGADTEQPHGHHVA